MTSQRSSYIPRPSIESSTALDRSSINDIHQFQLILLGDIAVGKSSLLRRYIDDSFTSEYFCTVGVEYNVKTQSVDNSIADFRIWDTCGEEKYRAITRQYYAKCDGIILVFDLTNKESFNNLEFWFADIKTNAPEDPVIAVVGNKKDLNGSIKLDSNDIKGYLSKKDCNLYYESSALTGEGVVEIFQDMAKILLEKKKDMIIKRKEKEELKKLKKLEEQKRYNENESKKRERENKCC